jgi:ubiquinone/menaquinone biosynthesis C-methylase UbiE
MFAMIESDEDMARRVEAVYMTPDVIEQRRATRAVLSLQPGEHVLDIGSGPGFLATEMAAEVGSGGRVYGVDPSESMVASARRRDAPVEYRIGDALALPFPGSAL